MKRRSGFTLIEMMVVVVFTAITLVVAVDFFMDLTRASQAAMESTRTGRRATGILDRVSRDLQSAVLVVKPEEVDPLEHDWLFLAEEGSDGLGAERLLFVSRGRISRASDVHESDLELLRTGWQSSAERFGFDVEAPPPDPTAFVSDGDIVEVAGLRLRAIETPGHTPGSVSYYADEGLLFSGDTLFRGSIGRTDFPGGDFDEEMRSICDKLLALPDETAVLPGHMQETSIGAERGSNPFVRDWLARQQG